MSEQNTTLDARWQRLLTNLTHADAELRELSHLVRAITSESDAMMTEDACRTLLPAYVEAEMSGFDAVMLYPDIERHLLLSPALEAEYFDLQDMALAEEMNHLPDVSHLAPLDLSFLPALPSQPPRLTLSEYVSSLAEKLAKAIDEDLIDELEMVVELFFERVEALGKQFRLEALFVPTFGPGDDEISALQLLGLAYASTESLVSELSPQEIASQAQTDQLMRNAEQQATSSAQKVGLSDAQAQAIAAQYAQLVARDAETLETLAGG